jgi:hexosaminidase
MPRRRQSIRFIITVGVVVVFIFFLMLILQFSQTDFENEQNEILNRRKNRLRARIHEEDRQMNRDADFFKENSLDYRSGFSKIIDSMHKLVHLDLKGSPPKLNYVKTLIPYYKSLGATGVLIEYEDFFPYQNELEAIANQNHYTQSELEQILELLKSNDMIVIPLIQTYGHLEFVLKLKQYAYLREDEKYFNVISPCLNDTYEKVLFRLIDQMLDAHPTNLEYIHIGCDEVYFVNKNPACSSSGLKSVEDYFIKWIIRPKS